MKYTKRQVQVRKTATIGWERDLKSRQRSITRAVQQCMQCRPEAWADHSRHPRASRGPRRPRPPRPHRSRQTRLSSVTAVARLVGYLAPRPRPQLPGRSPTVCLVLVFVCVLLCVTVRPFVFVRVFARPTRLLTALRPPACPTPSRPLAHRVPQQQPPGPHRHYGGPRLNTHATAKCHPPASQLCCL